MDDGTVAAPPDPVDERLAGLLGGPVPAGLAALPPGDRAALAEVIEEARERQREALAGAFDTALRHIPAPFRVLVRKALGR